MGIIDTKESLVDDFSEYLETNGLSPLSYPDTVLLELFLEWLGEIGLVIIPRKYT